MLPERELFKYMFVIEVVHSLQGKAGLFYLCGTIQTPGRFKIALET